MSIALASYLGTAVATHQTIKEEEVKNSGKPFESSEARRRIGDG